MQALKEWINKASVFAKSWISDLSLTQLFFIINPLLLFLLISFEWVHVFPIKGSLISYFPVDFEKNYTGEEILSSSKYYFIILLFFSFSKVLNKLFLPLYIFGLYWFYFALESFVEGKKPPLFADKVMPWFDYEFFLPFYCFAGLYVAAILLSIFLLFKSKNNVQAQQ